MLAGTTTVVDHHESPNLIAGSLDLLAQEADALGVRLITAYGVTERNGGRVEARAGLDECARFVRAGGYARVRGMVGLHASFTCSDDTVAEALALAKELGVGMHVHVAEDLADVDDARRRGWAGPLERIEALGGLPAGSVVAHGVHLSAAQVRRAAERGWLVHNPRSNEGNRVGYAGVLGASERVALGTDGWPSQMGVEVAALERLAAAHGDTGAGGRLRAGGRLAGELLGVALPPPWVEGAAADLVVRAPGGVRHVVVAGEVVVRDGRLVRADLDEIRAFAAEQAPRLWARMAEVDDG